MLDCLQKFDKCVTERLLECCRPGTNCDEHGNRSCKAADKISQLWVLMLNRVWLPDYNRVLPAVMHHDDGPHSEQKALHAHVPC